MFRRAAAITGYRLPSILKENFEALSDHFPGEVPIQRRKFGHANAALDVPEALLVVINQSINQSLFKHGKIHQEFKN